MTPNPFLLGNSNIWWVPLKLPLTHVQQMVDWIMKAHAGDIKLEQEIPSMGTNGVTEFLHSRFRIPVLNFHTLMDAYSAAFVHKALRQG